MATASGPAEAHEIFDVVMDHLEVDPSTERAGLFDEGRAAVTEALRALTRGAERERDAAALTLVFLAELLVRREERPAADDVLALARTFLGDAFARIEGEVRDVRTATGKQRFSRFAAPKDARPTTQGPAAGRTVRGVGVQFKLAAELDR